MSLWTQLEGPELCATHCVGAIGRTESDRLLVSLLDQLKWNQHEITMFGKTHASPRLSAWHGDPEAVYTYSQNRLEPQPWTDELDYARKLMQTLTDTRFNSVLVNRYRDGQDSMGWHADDEPELGPNPIIASLSLGASRKFHLRRKDNHKEKVSLPLGHGDVIVMSGATQRYWAHQVPKTAAVVGERVNLTFRMVRSSPT